MKQFIRKTKMHPKEGPKIKPSGGISLFYKGLWDPREYPRTRFLRAADSRPLPTTGLPPQAKNFTPRVLFLIYAFILKIYRPR